LQLLAVDNRHCVSGQLAKDFDAMFPDSEDPQKPILQKLYAKAVRQVIRNPDGTIAESDSESDLEEAAGSNEEEEDYEDDDVRKDVTQASMIEA
jgi:hypothetical protein